MGKQKTSTGHTASIQANTASWMAWDEYDVGKWMKEHGLERYAVAFVENGIRGENLPDCLDEDKLSGNPSSDTDSHLMRSSQLWLTSRSGGRRLSRRSHT